MSDDDSSNRRSGKSRDTISCAYHTHPDALLSYIGRQVRQGWWVQAHTSTSKQAVDTSPSVQPSDRGYPSP
ncbi:unnamed protein product [Fusarium graminearum]|nr:unnamed protein product [Fusarium graminearum]CAG1961123.1 unnamed protein product [Fusarium graminearum]VTO83805.1 unnamed protein product [Fusarium graminearum]